MACCRRSEHADPSDLYPDADAAPLRSALHHLGAVSTLVSWDDPQADWSSYSHVVVSSTWDSVDRPAEFLAWVGEVSRVSELINSAAAIGWNLDKGYLRHLEGAEVPVIPTTWVLPADDWQPPDTAEFVIKPSVSAGGRSTARYSGGDAAALEHVPTLQRVGQTVMVQEYLVDRQSRRTQSRVPRRHIQPRRCEEAGFADRGGVVERPWERMAWAGLVAPDDHQFRVAEQAMVAITVPAAAARLWPCRCLAGTTGDPLVLEVELIDPYLSLDLEPGAASRLARAPSSRFVTHPSEGLPPTTGSAGKREPSRFRSIADFRPNVQ